MLIYEKKVSVFFVFFTFVSYGHREPHLYLYMYVDDAVLLSENAQDLQHVQMIIVSGKYINVLLNEQDMYMNPARTKSEVFRNRDSV